MAKKSDSHLGKGLGAIFGDDLSNVIEDIQNNAENKGFGRRATLQVDTIKPNPYQPRRVFDQTKLEELAASISEHGVFTPILVRQTTTGGYELITGERRLRASILAKKTDIPAIIVEFDDQQMMEISLLENVQREDLSIIEEAGGYNKLMTSLGYTQEQLAKRVGKSREYIANTLRLLKLPANVQTMVQNGQLSAGQVRPLITLGSAKEMTNWANKIANIGLSARQVEMMLKKDKGQSSAKQTTDKKAKDDPALKSVRLTMQKKLGTKVSISDQAIVISYKDTDDLNRILEIIGCLTD